MNVAQCERWIVAAPGRLEPSGGALPRPSDDEVVVAVEAVALNRRDLTLLDGARSAGRDMRGCVPCSDAAGTVVACGRPGPYAVGDRVLTRFLPDWVDGPPPSRDLLPGFGGPLPGVLATHLIAPVASITRAPAWLSSVEACTLPCAGLTAWSALGGQPLEQRYVGIHGSGGVSTFALQIAAARGARVLVVTRDPSRSARLRALGATAVVDATGDWPQRILDLTGGRGVDLAVDMGVRGTLDQWLRLAAPGGIVAVVGVLDGARVDLDIGPCIRRAVSLRGVCAGSAADFVAFENFLGRTRLGPVVDAVVPFAAAPRAFERLRDSTGTGKVVVKVA